MPKWAGSVRGAMIAPSSTARLIATPLREPRSRTVVNPWSSSLRASETARAQLSMWDSIAHIIGSGLRLPKKCMCASMSPGDTVCPSASITRQPLPTVTLDSGAILTMRSPSMTIAAPCSGVSSRPLRTMPPRMRVVVALMCILLERFALSP